MKKNQKQLPKKGKYCYLPYDAIYKVLKSWNKRVVVDFWSKFNGSSINKTLLSDYKGQLVCFT